MIPSNGSVSPNTNSSSRSPAAGDAERADREARHRRDDQGDRHDREHDEHARREERAHVRDLERLEEVAPLRIRRNRQPDRDAARWVEGRREDAEERQDRDRDQGDQERPAGVDLPSGDPHRALPARDALDRQDHDQDEHHQDDRQRRGQADLPLEERQDVDLDAGDGRGVAGSAAGRDVDDVERRQGGDHRDRDAHADLVSQARHRDVPELLEPSRAVDPGRLEQGGVDPRHAGQQQDGAEAEQDPDPDEADRRQREVEVAEPGARDVAETDRRQRLVDRGRSGTAAAPR